MALVGSISGSLVAITGSIRPGADNVYEFGTSASKWLNVVATSVTGSITRLASGGEYLKPGSNITLTTGSDGSITITSTATGGGGGETIFTAVDTSRAYTTSSIAIGFNAAANSKGSDVFFAVSGSSPSSNTALFSGPVVASGSISVKDAGSTVGTITGTGIISGSALQTRGDLTVQGNSILTGSLIVGSNQISGSAGGNIQLGTSGDVRIAGDLTVSGNDIFFAAAAGNIATAATSLNVGGTSTTTLTLGGTSSKVVVAGDFEVQGTTITLSASNLVVEDPLVGFGFLTSSIASTAGDRGFIGGLAGENNVAMFWDETADGFAVSRTTSSPGDTVVAIADYSTFRSGKLELNGSSVYVTSSDGSSAAVNVAASNTLTFQQNGVNKIQLGDINTGEARIMGLSTGTTLGRLWLSGSTIGLGHSSAGGEGIRISNNETETGRITSAGIVGSETLSIRAASGAGQPRALTITGSQVTIGGNTNGTVEFTRQGSTHLTVSSDGGNNPTLTAAGDLNLKASGDDIKFLGGSSSNAFLTFTNIGDAANVVGFTNKQVTLGTVGSADLVLSGAQQIQLNAGSNGFSLNRDNSPIGKVEGVASTSLSIYARGAASSALALTLSGSSVIIGANTATGVQFYTAGTHGATLSNTSNVVGLAAGPGMSTANVFNGTVTTVNFAGNASTVLNMGNSSGATWISGSVSVPGTFSALGSVNLGDASSDRLNIVAAVTSSIIPSDDSAFTLGTPDKRWQHIYTGDLHLRNERGDYTLIEENDFLSIRFNKNGKRYKFLLERVPELDEPAR
jgi:hypothetical protein